MKRALAGLALGVLLCSPAIAATSIDTAAFTITYVDGPVPEDWSITQVDVFPDTYSFSLDTLNQHLAVEAHDIAGAGATADQNFWSALRLDIDAGYRVSRIMLTGVAFGQMAPGQLPDFPPGIVHNEANAHLTVGSTTWSALHTDIGAENPIDVSTPVLDLTGMADVGISGMLLAQAWGVEGGGAFAESIASASLYSLVLHVEVSPIPEPHAFLMLAAGLGIVGWAARRRDRLPGQSKRDG
ncbi:PEP-CTERM sorting domain-containing protein [Pseudoduganella umbonata]|uniref:PEP-CTERM sorting domain-containing protein n=1 Tax=Pseudoduganella umbonata TaxID=864828 RepID=A0A4P8HHH7_9BURK|nr:PEP-CTERM sorting domain-containing protein [Pseudoduganella umbonata]MBB3221777.1 hypothetical protein [Pseudoduganella umbonata]QCP09009.1 PEP-CTERM sorting domain-containing protein [Pseudoduganella umbonata]